MNQGTPHIVLAGGGTAGHVNPLLPRSPGRFSDIRTHGTGRRHRALRSVWRRIWCRRPATSSTPSKECPFPRRPNLYMLRFPAKWKRETAKVRSVLETRHADVVAGFGGYASAPVYATAHKMGIPIAIHEQNARAGMANKLGARLGRFHRYRVRGRPVSNRVPEPTSSASVCRCARPSPP